MRIGHEPVPPVFVDPSGARRRRLRRLAYLTGVALLLVLLALWLSQLGGPVRPSTTVPCASAHTGSVARGDCR
jgi:hypothetical protein